MPGRKRAGGSAESGGIKKKRGFLDGYKTYDPSVEGYGNVGQWKAIFEAVMSGAEAARVIKSQTRSPLDILGLNAGFTAADLRSAYRARINQHRAAFGETPDKTSEAAAREVIAAYTVLKAQVEGR